MRYKVLFWVTATKIMWCLFPLAAIIICCIINPQLLDNGVLLSFLLSFFGVSAFIRVMGSVGEHLAELYIDDDVVRLTILGKAREIYWRNALAIEISPPSKRLIFAYRLLIVRAEKETIQYCLSDLDPADQEAIRQHIASLPSHERAIVISRIQR
jgi:hypothetical protein